MANEVFKTMLEVSEEETLHELTGWRPPLFAYCLFESKVWKINRDGTRKRGHGLFTMNLEGRPEQKDKFYYYCRKGYRPIHYGNFPSHNDSNMSRSQKAKLYSGPGGENPWDDMKAAIVNYMNKERSNSQLEIEKKGLEAKLEAARKEIESMKGAKKGQASQHG